MKNQLVGLEAIRSAWRFGGRLLLAGSVTLVVACGNGNNPVSPSTMGDVSQSAQNLEASAFPNGGTRSMLSGAEKTTICHQTGGNNGFVITRIADSALQAHMDHGDLYYSPLSRARATFSSSLNAASAPLAFDGNPLTMWNAGSHPVQYIEVDFGSPQSFREITALVEQTPTGATNHQVTLDGRSTPEFSWTGVTGNGELLTHRFAVAQTAQKIRITTTDSPSWVAWREIQFASC